MGAVTTFLLSSYSNSNRKTNIYQNKIALIYKTVIFQQTYHDTTKEYIRRNKILNSIIYIQNFGIA